MVLSSSLPPFASFSTNLFLSPLFSNDRILKIVVPKKKSFQVIDSLNIIELVSTQYVNAHYTVLCNKYLPIKNTVENEPSINFREKDICITQYKIQT